MHITGKTAVDRLASPFVGGLVAALLSFPARSRRRNPARPSCRGPGAEGRGAGAVRTDKGERLACG